MRQTCPHCSVEFHVAEDKITGKWAFSKCPSCSGMSVVKAAAKPALPARPVAMAQPAARPPAHPPVMKAAPAAETPKVPPPLPKAEDFLSDIGVSLEQMESDISMAQKVSSHRPNPRVVAPFAVLFALSLTLYLLSPGSKDPASAAPESQKIITTQAQAVQSAPQQQPAAPVAPAARPATIVAASAEPASAPVTRIVTRIEPNLRVQVAVESAVLRSGPGIAYRRVGVASPELQFIVKSWKQDWFQVEAVSPGQEAAETAWIRNDLVKPVIEARNL